MKLNARWSRWVAGNLHNQLWKTLKKREYSNGLLVNSKTLKRNGVHNPWCWLKSHFLSGKLYIHRFGAGFISCPPWMAHHPQGMPHVGGYLCIGGYTATCGEVCSGRTKGSAGGLGAQVKLFVFGQEVYIYIYICIDMHRKGRFCMCIFTYTNIQIYTLRSIEVVFVLSGFVLRNCARLISKTTAQSSQSQSIQVTFTKKHPTANPPMFLLTL